ncbi:hypothetical protein [Spongiactinospora sp. TRM90649]|uniref:hypothetical protein n=1 Tax=Spongiactinospora sp. TRM90649 TaxID=3031114 RepID=UPI0023F78435|nr:hypothetical protein [Spongiactinospora sp. TRM90649]MDF5757336.1 hypothetical protein [Spongiactinospora sp. TRM90649]
MEFTREAIAAFRGDVEWDLPAHGDAELAHRLTLWQYDHADDERPLDGLCSHIATVLHNLDLYGPDVDDRGMREFARAVWGWM